MSSSLKERLKKSSRSFSSPLSRVQSSAGKIGTCSNDTDNTSFNRAKSSVEIPTLSKEDIDSCDDLNVLQNMHLSLKEKISANEEKLRKLELVERYHMKVFKYLVKVLY